KKEEAKKRAFMEDKALREKRHQESAEQKREKLEKDSQVQRKRQEKKELCELERIKDEDCKKEQKPKKQVTENAEKQVASHKSQRQKHKKVSEGIRSQYVHDEREKNVPEMVKFQEKCKKMAYDNLQDIRRQEYVKDALEEKKFYKEMTKQEFAQKLLDKQEREKKVEIKKSLTDAWDGQVEYKRQKKMEMDKIKKQGSYSLMESERLHRTEEVEKKQKKQKLSTQDKTEQNMRDQMITQCEERRFQLRAKQQLGQKLREEQEREKKAILKKSLTDALDEQIQYKQQKKKEIAEIEKQQMAAIMESDRLHQIEEIEMKRQKKRKDRKFFSRQDETEPNMEDQKKTVDDNLEDILKKEAAYDSLLQKKLCNNMAKEEVAKMLREAHHQEMKTPKQKPLADELAARYQYKQKQKRETDRTERQGVLPGYRAEEIGARRQKKDPQQKLKTQNKTKKYMDNPDAMQWEMHHSVTEQKEEAKKRAFMEDKLLKEKRHRESAEQKREKLEKEKKAAAIKSLTNSWDSQIQRKQQEKKELCEIERKD
uniref:Uncharacterized protein n=1 Tax=Poecilia formosa TaxID=48698 RepID=A0A096M4S2_POEFO